MGAAITGDPEPDKMRKEVDDHGGLNTNNGMENNEGRLVAMTENRQKQRETVKKPDLKVMSLQGWKHLNLFRIWGIITGSREVNGVSTDMDKVTVG